jgi:1-deoxy-D-xylulose-5-phosphate reductoisomerase
VQTLDVLRECLPEVEVRVLSGYSNMEKLAQQVVEFSPKLVWVPDGEKAGELLECIKHFTNSNEKGSVPTPPEILTGHHGLLTAACEGDVLVNALVGQAGLAPTMAAIRAGKRIALANKESLVSGGKLLMQAARAAGVQIMPIDSEHSAIWQCLAGNEMNKVEKIYLTASGGPFRTWAREAISAAHAKDALKHPNWTMGAKITIDSATMMNEGLELIEAMHLFDLSHEQIEILVHPESIVHSMVQFCDGAVMAQLGAPDMRLPILYALGAPVRVGNNFGRVDFLQARSLNFEAPDFEKFPCLQLAVRAVQMGGCAPAVLNCVNEWAVQMYLNNRIKFYDISAIIGQALDSYTVHEPQTLEDIDAAQKWANEFVLSLKERS